MNNQMLIKLYESRGYNKEAIEKAISTVISLEEYLQTYSKSLENADISDIQKYITILIDQHNNTIENFMAIARYYYLLKKHDIYIYFTKILGGLGVIDNIKKRAKKYVGIEIMDTIFKDLHEPPLGTPFEEIPHFTQKLMKRIQDNVEPNIYMKILAGNNHGIPEIAMEKEKELYNKSENLEDYLKQRHMRKVAELQSHCDSNTVWFEQHITQEVVDFVKSNQEILSAVKKNDKLYVTKIPYDTVSFIEESDPKMKCYHACHCPFAREAILNEDIDIPSDWCYCSAGFAKFPFEIILEKELSVKVVSSPLKGDNICRFEISLKDTI